MSNTVNVKMENTGHKQEAHSTSANAGPSGDGLEVAASGDRFLGGSGMQKRSAAGNGRTEMEGKCKAPVGLKENET